MIISGMVKSSLVDYPGLVAAVLFVPGCNYNCFYCHNRFLLDGTHDILDLQEIRNFLNKRVGLLDGIVITGGEPTLQQGLLTFLRELKGLGYKIKLDTNGSSPMIMAQILQAGLCDYIAVDYKAPSARYQEVCGKSARAEPVIKTIKLLMKYQVDFEVRTTVIPQLKEEDLRRMVKELPVVPLYVLNRYRVPAVFLPEDQDRILQKPYTQEQIDALKTIIEVRPKATENITEVQTAGLR